ncbi:hypothetical protein [Companilactobacillus nuruki]|uniref:Surface layer protein A domain-containing protein n=1 Tax=Companilactobacillus nuruki TaxID=1993540 RepID=A0A2N7AS84_9LACO|nr:hypothetical protein [Companilactobacillus nuruki]PMD68223.1 hypothetical protein CBP76_10385 [Companilactobacillus nuruki]
MKKIVKVILATVVVFISLLGLKTTNVKAATLIPDYLHTSKVTKVYAQGKANVSLGADPTYDFSLITNRALSSNSDWKFDQFAYGKDNTYKRVATNEWVNESEVTCVYSVPKGDVLNLENSQRIYRLDYKTYSLVDSGKTLQAGSWLIDKLLTVPNNQGSYVQVATNEWIKN